MGSSSSIEVKADRSTTKFSQITPLDIQEPPRPKKASRTSAWHRSNIFLSRQKVAASLVQKAARDDHDQNKQTEQKEVDEEQEGIEAVCSIRFLSKDTMRGMMGPNHEGSELGYKAHDECCERSRAGTAPPPLPSCCETSGPPQKPDAKTSQPRKSKVPTTRG
ncbi:unnamed protein product [Polarella glacialis]|uniref:Uncharacterized protein n=1 Tax=Polarella glacialis TaxID=89957 RepID=A0A813EYI4_POLGL|nr:unnamed protein product [Polarella glacialis]